MFSSHGSDCHAALDPGTASHDLRIDSPHFLLSYTAPAGAELGQKVQGVGDRGLFSVLFWVQSLFVKTKVLKQWLQHFTERWGRCV